MLSIRNVVQNKTVRKKTMIIKRKNLLRLFEVSKKIGIAEKMKNKKTKARKELGWFPVMYHMQLRVVTSIVSGVTSYSIVDCREIGDATSCVYAVNGVQIEKVFEVGPKLWEPAEGWSVRARFDYL